MNQPATNQQPQQGSTGAIVRTAKDKIAMHTAAVERAKKSFAQLLPKHVTPDQMIRSVTAAISRTPDLIACDTKSLILAVAQACATGLVPNTPLGLGYLVPFKIDGKMSCQFIPSYRGMIRLATNSGEVKAITAHVVYERDTCEVHEGTSPRIEHTRYMGDEAGKAVGYYAVAHMANGEKPFAWMTIAQVDAIRTRAKAKSGPWDTDYDEMARKTVTKRLCKYLQLSEDRHRDNALAIQTKQEMGDSSPIDDVIDAIGAEVVDEDTGEVTSQEPPKGRVSNLRDRVAEKANVPDGEVTP